MPTLGSQIGTMRHCIFRKFTSWHALQIFQRFHAAYVDAISNPFYTMDTVSHRRC